MLISAVVVYYPKSKSDKKRSLLGSSKDTKDAKDSQETETLAMVCCP